MPAHPGRPKIINQRWLGCVGLIAGTTVGAGVLALPAVTFPAGIVPSSVLMLAVWVYALISGLLIAEVTLNLKAEEPGLLTMVKATLGRPWALGVSGIYLFLHYALLTAYTAQGGTILGQLIGGLPGLIFFAFGLGGFVALGRDSWVQGVNLGITIMTLFAFGGVMLSLVPDVSLQAMHWQDWSQLGGVLPVLLVAMFYHNVVPVVSQQLQSDRRQLCSALAVGSAIPLALFWLWNFVMLSASPLDPAVAELTLDSLLNQGNIPTLLSLFSMGAIATSFIGFVYGLLNYFQDAFQLRYLAGFSKMPVYSGILLPVIFFAALDEHIFLSAINYSGIFCITLLGGVLPALMAGKLRQQPNALQLVPGGTTMLAGMVAVSSLIVVYELWLKLSV